MARIKKVRRKIPTLTTEQMIEVDRLMIESYHIELIQMMENAGRCLAILARDQFLKRKFYKRKVVILAGPGGNGGGAMVCARRLHAWGAKVYVGLSSPKERITPVPRHQLDILERMDVPIYEGKKLDKLPKPDLIIDGIIGYSIKGEPYGRVKQLIEWANAQAAPILSLDTPSGLNLTTGEVHTPCIQAAATLTLALPKQGLYHESALPKRGTLYLGDISVPPDLYRKRSLKIKFNDKTFESGDVIRIS